MSGEKQDNDEVMILAIGLVFAFLYILYYFLSDYLFMAWYYIRLPFILPLNFIPDSITNILFFWSKFFSQTPLSDIIATQYNLFIALDPEPYVDNEYLRNDANFIFQVVYSPFIIVLGIKMFIRVFNIKLFNTPFNLKSLREQESELWPTIKPAIYHSNKTIFAIDEGDWRMSTRPEAVSQKWGLTSHYKDDYEENFFTLDYYNCYNYFYKQLGNKWKGIDDLKIEERYLLTIFLLKANRETKRAENLLNLLGNYYTSKKSFMINRKRKKYLKKIKSEVDMVLEQANNSKPNKKNKSYYTPNYYELLKEASKKHYYKITVFSYMLEKAREDGVLANGQFLWLKPINRNLFYMMASIGRRLPFFDSAGPWCHYIYEQSIDHFSSMPKIENAVVALDEYFETRYYNYDSLYKQKEE